MTPGGPICYITRGVCITEWIGHTYRKEPSCCPAFRSFGHRLRAVAQGLGPVGGCAREIGYSQLRDAMRRKSCHAAARTAKRVATPLDSHAILPHARTREEVQVGTSSQGRNESTGRSFERQSTCHTSRGVTRDVEMGAGPAGDRQKGERVWIDATVRPSWTRRD